MPGLVRRHELCGEAAISRFYRQKIAAVLLVMWEEFSAVTSAPTPFLGQAGGGNPGSKTTSLRFAGGGTACEDEAVLTQPCCNGGKVGDVYTVLRRCGDQG